MISINVRMRSNIKKLGYRGCYSYLLAIHVGLLLSTAARNCLESHYTDTTLRSWFMINTVL